jgi:nitroreductase
MGNPKLDLFEVLNNRRSVRKYLKISVEKEKLLKVLDAARLAPSAMNRQPYSLIIVSEDETIKRISYACNQ